MTMHEFRRKAAGMDLDIQHLAREGLQGPAMIERMVSHLPDLARIWSGASDDQLATLCQEFPGFRQYARLMEEAAVLERSKPSRCYDDLPELPDALKEVVAALLATAATLERRYGAVLDADSSAERQVQLNDLNSCTVAGWPIWRSGAVHACREEISRSQASRKHLAYGLRCHRRTHCPDALPRHDREPGTD